VAWRGGQAVGGKGLARGCGAMEMARLEAAAAAGPGWTGTRALETFPAGGRDVRVSRPRSGLVACGRGLIAFNRGGVAASIGVLGAGGARIGSGGTPPGPPGDPLSQRRASAHGRSESPPGGPARHKRQASLRL